VGEPTPNTAAPLPPPPPPPPLGRRGRTFYALEIPNYRRYLLAQTISLIGTWLQYTGQIWLVVKVLAPGNGFVLGVTTAVQSAPILLTLLGGASADRRDKRHVLMVTQSLSGLIALTLGLATLTKVVDLPIVWVCALALGLVNSFDAPARQALVSELVDDAHRPSAIALNSTSYQGMRAVGVGLTPLMALWLGLSAPFLFNAVSFIVVLIALTRMDTDAMFKVERKRKERPKVREGLSLIRTDPQLLAPIFLLSMVAVFALNFDVTLPLLATDTLHSGLTLVSTLLTVSSIGAVASSLFIAGARHATFRAQCVYSGILAVTMCALALSPKPWLAAIFMFPLGASIAATTATTNTLLQQRSPPEMRGRIMSVYGLAMQGSSLIGGLVVGALADPRVWGAPGGLYIGAGAIAAGLGAGVFILRGRRRAPGADPAARPKVTVP
jgi:MFS family permease